MLLPLSISFPLQCILLLLPVTIPSCSSYTVTKSWWSPGAHVDLSQIELQGPASYTFLLLTDSLAGLQHRRPQCEVRGSAKPTLGTPMFASPICLPRVTPVSYIFTCALWSLFSSSCLINCFVSLSSFLLLLIDLFAYKREEGIKKGNQSISMPLQVSSNLPQNPRTLRVWERPLDLI